VLKKTDRKACFIHIYIGKIPDYGIEA